MERRFISFESLCCSLRLIMNNSTRSVPPLWVVLVDRPQIPLVWQATPPVPASQLSLQKCWFSSQEIVSAHSLTGSQAWTSLSGQKRFRHVHEQALFIFDHLEGEAREETKFCPQEKQRDQVCVLAILKELYGCSQSYVTLQQVFFSRHQQ